MEKHLTNNEKIVYQAKIHWISIAFSAIFTAIGGLTLLFIVLLITVAGKRNLFSLLNLILVFVGYWFLKLFFFGLKNLLENLRTKIFVTNKRIILKTGIFGTNIDDMLLSKSDALSFSQTFLGKRLNYGQVQISTIGENGLVLR